MDTNEDKTSRQQERRERAERKNKLLFPAFPTFLFGRFVSIVSIFAPAKLNLFLAITGRRPDGFHDLVSVAAQLDFGDTLRAEPAEAFSLTSDDPELAVDATNLVLKAAMAFAAATKSPVRAKFFLGKRIPTGAGLGGGSSDAVAALRALNQLAGRPLGPAALAVVAAQLGSDCPLFLHDAPVVMRGRGERIEPLSRGAAERLRGRRVLIFKPGFAIATPWAYAQLAAAAPASYLPAAIAEERLSAWIGDSAAPAEKLLFNNMEPPAFGKFVALPELLERLHTDFGLAPRMSGSGSACFAFLPDDAPVDVITARIRAAWGDSAFVAGARLT
jgi:4-diphosphocytidyl-2-C-methyl-D-erythritol kinase